MSHSHSVIEPADGLTVLVGPNNCGKSSIVAALQILAHNANSTYVLRHNEKHCEIKVETDDQHIIVWQRGKNQSPRYYIDGQLFDRLGQSGTPEELDAALRLPLVRTDKETVDVHFGEQKSPTFLLNERPRVAAEFFASSSDTIRLIEMQSLHKQRTADAKRTQKETKQQLLNHQQALTALEPLDEIIELIKLAQHHHDWIGQQESEIQSGQIVVQQFAETGIKKSLYAAKEQALSPLSPPPELTATKTLISLIRDLETAVCQTEVAAAKLSSLQSIDPPPKLHVVQSAETMADSLELQERQLSILHQQHAAFNQLKQPEDLCETVTLGGLLGEIDTQIQQKKSFTERNRKIDADLEWLKDEMQAVIDANPICPTCGGEMTVEQILDEGHGHE